MTEEQLVKMQKVWPIVNYLPPKTMGVLSPEGFKKLYDMFGAVQSAVRLIEIRDAQIEKLREQREAARDENDDEYTISTWKDEETKKLEAEVADIEKNWGKQ